MRERLPLISLLVLLGTVLLLTAAAYYSGLHGGFLFDDFANLPAIGAGGKIDSWSIFWRYLTSGTADPTGRPLTLLTFLLDARDWPAAPYPFKRTNLILHLLNGSLLALALRNMGREARFFHPDRHRTDMAAVLAAGIWLLHPLFVSTTLYIVQREAILPATFTLLGLLLWMHGRRKMQRGQNYRGVCWIAFGLGGCTVLGTLCKANGILLPALATVIEYILLRRFDWMHHHSTAKLSDTDRTGPTPATAYRRTMILFAWIPTVFVAGYLADQAWNGFVYGISAARPWTLGERLLTEPRVLLDYLRLLWLPRPFTSGLFNDHIQASTSVWSPATTLPALLAVSGLIAGAWLIRRRWPALALAILFYFVGQSLESSTVALELYFEHRNYLPSMLMFWPLALWLCDARLIAAGESALPERMAASLSGKSWRNPKLLLAGVILLSLSWMTHSLADLWGNTKDQALLWAKLNPGSSRAQANAAEMEMNTGQPILAVARLRPLLAEHPEEVQLALNLFGAECELGHVEQSTIDASRRALHTTRDPGALLTSWFTRSMGQISQSPCQELTIETIQTLLDAALTNNYLAANPGRYQDLYYLKGRVALLQRDGDTALTDFNRALDLQVRPDAAMQQAALLGASGFPKQGLEHLKHYQTVQSELVPTDFGMPRIHAWVLRRQHYWQNELAHLQATLRDDAAHNATGNQ